MIAAQQRLDVLRGELADVDYAVGHDADVETGHLAADIEVAGADGVILLLAVAPVEREGGAAVARAEPDPVAIAFQRDLGLRLGIRETGRVAQGAEVGEVLLHGEVGQRRGIAQDDVGDAEADLGTAAEIEARQTIGGDLRAEHLVIDAEMLDRYRY